LDVDVTTEDSSGYTMNDHCCCGTPVDARPRHLAVSENDAHLYIAINDGHEHEEIPNKKSLGNWIVALLGRKLHDTFQRALPLRLSLQLLLVHILNNPILLKGLVIVDP
jgi:hypothetical protein